MLDHQKKQQQQQQQQEPTQKQLKQSSMMMMNKLKSYNLRFEAFITSNDANKRNPQACFKLILLMENGQRYELYMSLAMLDQFVSVLSNTLHHQT